MCGVPCACPETDAAPWKALSEATLNSYSRTGAAQTGTDPADSNGNYYLVTAADGSDGTYESYEDCVIAVNAELEAQGQDPASS